MKSVNPRRIDKTLTPEIQTMAEMILNDSNLELPAPYSINRILATNNRGGICYYQGDNPAITIPTWSYRKGVEYLAYYVAHELSHAFAYQLDKFPGHGAVFMKWFIRLCPLESQRFEIEFKPRFAKAAGIGVTL